MVVSTVVKKDTNRSIVQKRRKLDSAVVVSSVVSQAIGTTVISPVATATRRSNLATTRISAENRDEG